MGRMDQRDGVCSSSELASDFPSVAVVVLNTTGMMHNESPAKLLQRGAEKLQA